MEKSQVGLWKNPSGNILTSENMDKPPLGISTNHQWKNVKNHQWKNLPVGIWKKKQQLEM